DTNLPQQTIEFIAKNVTCPIFCDPVSSIKAQKLKKVLGKLYTLKPNRLEAEMLSGIKITDDASLEAAAHELLATGLKRVFISLGEKGLLCADHEKTIRLPLLPAKLINMTGAGDAMMAGITWAYTQGMTLEQTGLVGMAASSIAIEGEETINSQLNVEEVIKRAGI
ncbi:MAG: PfkB family carbohydrate kinase, partial [Lancefieldella parvula]